MKSRGSPVCNVKAAATNVPLTVGVSAPTTFGRNKPGKMRAHSLLPKPVRNLLPRGKS